ncbi:MAG: DNA cytosine methyltransferase [Pseudomonadota bacterium]
MSNVVYRKIGIHKGKKRIWFEGQKLAFQGIEPGMQYSLEPDPEAHQIIIIFKKDGDLTVSRRKNKNNYLPVMDVRSDDIKSIFGDAERVRAVIHPDKIVITIHHRDIAQKERLDRIINKLLINEPLEIGSIAHGGGILDHALHTGFKMGGISTRLNFAVEIERKYLDCSQRNNPIWDKNSIAIESPMQDVEINKLSKIDLFFVGLPCQGASLSGRSRCNISRAEEHETAGSLFVSFLNFITVLQPAIIVLEEVDKYINTASMTVIRSVLTDFGYTLHETIIEGNKFGALESRKRLCMVGMTKGLNGFNFNKVKPLRIKEPCLNDILDIIPDDSYRWKNKDSAKAKEIKDKKAGKGFRRNVVTGIEDKCKTIGAGYSRIRQTEASLKHPTKDLERILTPREHAKVKTIPFMLVDGLSDNIAHQVLGNSVIHCAFQAVGKAISEAINLNINKLQSVA